MDYSGAGIRAARNKRLLANKRPVCHAPRCAVTVFLSAGSSPEQEEGNALLSNLLAYGM